MTRLRRGLLVTVLAVLGIAVAAAITYGTSQLVRQHIGLASEPITAGQALLPTQSATGQGHAAAPVRRAPGGAPTVTAPVPAASAPSSSGVSTAAQPPPRGGEAPAASSPAASEIPSGAGTAPRTGTSSGEGSAARTGGESGGEHSASRDD